MRAFVTGATGFLGTALVKALKCPVVALVRDKAAYVAAGEGLQSSLIATICHGDLSDIPTLERILAEYRIDTVFHLAAQTEIAVGVADPVGTFETNIRGTWNVLEACRRQKVERVVVASSDKAYGRSAPPYVETMPLTPDRPYEASKSCVDLISHTYASTYGMSIATTRCVNLYGPRCMTLSTLVPNTVRRLLRGLPPIIKNGGTMKRDWLYIDDAVDAYLKLADSTYSGPMNFGGGQGVSVIEVVNLIREILKSDLPATDLKDEHGEIVNQWADTSLAKSVLGWWPRHTLRQGLVKTIEWYQLDLKREQEWASQQC